jgi:predicted nucleic acid-binding protein
MAEVVVDASALVDLLLGAELGQAVSKRLRGQTMHAPAHADAEVLSALGRLHRAGDVDAASVERAIADVAVAPIERHPVAKLLAGAWSRRQQLRLADALYLELATQLGLPLITTDRRLRHESVVEIVTT